jgi:hypothetical protein
MKNQINSRPTHFVWVFMLVLSTLLVLTFAPIAALVASMLPTPPESVVRPVKSIVNGPGEAREADLGVAAGKGKGQIIRRGEVLYTVAEADIVEALVHFANEMAEEIRAERGEGQPTVVA